MKHINLDIKAYSLFRKTISEYTETTLLISLSNILNKNIKCCVIYKRKLLDVFHIKIMLKKWGRE